MSNLKWYYRPVEKIEKGSLHIEVIADYGGFHTTDHAFDEVQNHFMRFDKDRKIRFVTEHPVFAFSTIETGFWIAQDGLHSEHKDLVIFSNTAPRGDIHWHGETRQAFACGMLDNGIPVFAVNAGYALSFIKDRLTCLYEVNVPNTGTQFRSRDQYPEATMAILYGDTSRIGREINIQDIPDVPKYMVASVDGYGNLKTTIRQSDLSSGIAGSSVLRATVNGISMLILNQVKEGVTGRTGDLCLMVGSSGGKNKTYLEIVRLQGRAAEDFKIEGPKDDMPEIKIEAIK